MEIDIEQLKIIQPRQPVLSVEIDLNTTEDDKYREIIEKALVEYALKNPKKTISVYNEIRSSVNFFDPGISDFFIFARSEPLAQYINKILLQKKIRSRLDYVLPEISNLSYHMENGKAWHRADMITFVLLGKQPDEER